MRTNDGSKVFDELAAAKPDSVSYIVLRLADDSFVHVSFHNHGDDEVNPIASTPTFLRTFRRITPSAARVGWTSRRQSSSVPISPPSTEPIRPRAAGHRGLKLRGTFRTLGHAKI